MIHEARRKQRGRFHLYATMPFIYGMVIPIAFIDLCTRIYQAVCFPIYGIELVERKSYTRYERSKLSYLDWIDRLNCDYCMYANGTIAYVREVLKRTEFNWCPIKNKMGGNFKPPEHQKEFAPYNDKKTLAKVLEQKN